MKRLRLQRSHVCWEAALNCGWQEGHATAAEKLAWAGIAGAFVGDVMLQLGAWSGVILTGRHVQTLRDPLRQQRFVQRMEDKSRYGRFVAMGSRSFLQTRDPLEGAFELLRARHAIRLPLAA
jgi:glucokinase